MKFRKLIYLISFFVLIPALVCAHENTSYQHSHLTGNWFGLRDSLSNSGFDFEFYYKNDFSYLHMFGSTNNSIYDIQNMDLDVNLDFDKMIGWSGASLFLDIQFISGPLPNYNILKSVQGFSNIEANNNILIYEMYYHQNFSDDAFNFSFGLIDYNSEFDVKHVGSNFITPSHGTGTDIALSGINGPSIFPVTSLGLKLGYQFADNFGMKLGIFDGIPGDTANPKGTHIILANSDGWFIAGEAELIFYDNPSEKMQQLMSIGFWYNTESKTNLFTNLIGHGFYFMTQNPLYFEKEDSTQGLSSYIRIGYGQSPTNPSDYFLAGALEYKGLISGRDNDFIGIGFTSSHISDSFLREAKKINPCQVKYDTNIELFYKMQIFPFLFVEPDVQYFFSPLLNSSSKDYLVLVLRTIIIL